MHGVVLKVWTAPVLVLAATIALPACGRQGPPQWDAGAGVSLAVAALPSGTPGASASASDGAVPAPDAGLAPTFAEAPTGDADGRLPQTRARPDIASSAFQARARALFDAVARDDVDHAMPFFFPLSAYAQVKAIANPAADWHARLASHYARDIHALHAKLGPHASQASFVAADVPMDRARWVEPGEEYNRIGYYRVYGTKLRGEIEGSPVEIDVTSLISWRGEWYCVHLTGVK